jgi:hypothetical protein
MSVQAWGWVLEMYAFTIACHLEGVAPASLHIKMMAQPPWDTKLCAPYGDNWHMSKFMAFHISLKTRACGCNTALH